MRIAIVNDLMLACEALRRAVVAGGKHQVAWIARDGAQAIEHARRDPPDLVLMDLVMPVVDGVEATRRIMAENPCPILVVTSTISGHIDRVYDAMGLGALDAVETPSLGPSGDVQGAARLLEKIDRIGRMTAARPVAAAVVAPAPSPTPAPAQSLPLVLLGASTGGPKALAEVLSGLPRDLDAAIVIVQHVDESYAPGLARWLADHTRRPVELATHATRPARGQVLLAAAHGHLRLGPDRRLAYDAEPADCPYRPSVDVLFRSAARHWPSPGVAALLTGMGRDGAEGLLALRRAGWLTLAQDEASSVVWGMPRAAVQLGAAELVLPPARIAESIAARSRATTTTPRPQP